MIGPRRVVEEARRAGAREQVAAALHREADDVDQRGHEFVGVVARELLSRQRLDDAQALRIRRDRPYHGADDLHVRVGDGGRVLEIAGQHPGVDRVEQHADITDVLDFGGAAADDPAHEEAAVKWPGVLLGEKQADESAERLAEQVRPARMPHVLLEDLSQRVGFAHALGHRETVAREAGRRHRISARQQRIADHAVPGERDGLGRIRVAVQIDDQRTVPRCGLVKHPQRSGSCSPLDVHRGTVCLVAMERVRRTVGLCGRDRWSEHPFASTARTSQQQECEDERRPDRHPRQREGVLPMAMASGAHRDLQTADCRRARFERGADAARRSRFRLEPDRGVAANCDRTDPSEPDSLKRVASVHGRERSNGAATLSDGTEGTGGIPPRVARQARGWRDTLGREGVPNKLNLG